MATEIEEVKAPAKKAAAKKTAAKKAPAKKAPAKKASSGIDEKKLAAQLAKIEKQVAANKKEQAEFRKQGREVTRVAKYLDKTRDELDNFREWTRTYFEEICAKFEGLAAAHLGQEKALARLDALEARLESVAQGAPIEVGTTAPASAPSTPELAKMKEELEQVQIRFAAIREELFQSVEEIRREAQSARTGLDDLINQNWQPIGWQEAPPEVL